MNENPNKSSSGFKVAGLNLLVFAVYTIACNVIGNHGDGAFVAMFLAIFHFVVCIIMAIVSKQWVWVLGGLIILIIGFATCVSNFSLGNMH